MERKRLNMLIGYFAIAIIIFAYCGCRQAQQTRPQEENDSRVAVASMHYSRGNAYLDANDLDSAISEYNKAIELDPNSADAYANRGLVYFKRSLFDQAILDFTAAIAIDPKDALVYNNRGLAFAQKKLFDLAIADYNKAAELNPQEAEFYYNLAVAYYYKKDYENSWRYINKAEVSGYKDTTGLRQWLENALAGGRKQR